MSKNKLSFSVILLISITVLVFHSKYKIWNKSDGVINNDVISYYEYLPAFFIQHDLSLSFKDDPEFKEGYQYWAFKTGEHKYVIKMSMGLSFMYLPFFLPVFLFHKILGHAMDGFSLSYHLAVAFSCLFYFLAGLFILRKILLNYFSDFIVSLCLLAIGIGTNLLNYVTLEPGMSHAFSFCLFNLFIWLTIQWHRKFSWRLTIQIGLLGGLIALIRPTNFLVFFIFLLYDVMSFNDLKIKILMLWKNKMHVFMISIFFLLIWLPQIVYWKYTTGHYLFFSYLGERFHFDRPHLIDGFIGYRKGLLIYTPIMIFSIMGFFYLKKRIPALYSGTLVFFILSSYVMLSWWCWWYGGSFGLRPFIDMYGLLALPLGCFFSFVFQKAYWKRVVLLISIGCLIRLQLFQSFQYFKGSIHYDSMTKEAYWATFLKMSPPQGWYYLLHQPDYEGARITGVEKPRP